MTFPAPSSICILYNLQIFIIHTLIPAHSCYFSWLIQNFYFVSLRPFQMYSDFYIYLTGNRHTCNLYASHLCFYTASSSQNQHTTTDQRYIDQPSYTIDIKTFYIHKNIVIDHKVNTDCNPQTS